MNEKGLFNERLFRVEKKDLESILHRSIAALTFIDGKKQPTAGSGVFISRNLMLTAAHNLYDRREHTENKIFKFYCGASGVAEKSFSIESFRYPQ